ncbi:glycosyltransferase [Actinomyces bowdenii]|nr:glycosyltransferase [Actinomyces bowdenii]
MVGASPQDAAQRPAVLIGGMTANEGGKEAFILSAFRLLKDGYDFTFLTDRDAIAHAEELRTGGARIVRVPERRHHPLEHLRAVTRVVRQGRYHAVWLHQTVVNSLEPLVAARRAGIPVRILHSHSSANMSGRISGVLHHLQRPLVSGCANRRYACSAEAAQWFFGSSPWTFVPNILDPRPFTFDPVRRRRMRTELGLGPQTTAIIHVARLGPAKNHVFDLGIMSHLRRMGTDAHLLLCGQGPYAQDLERRVDEAGLRSCVSFLGARSDVADLLQAADVMILPSTFEGLPYTALEAQAAGLPLLMSQAVSASARVGGVVEILDLAQGPQPWARRIAELSASPHARGPNAVIGSAFDAGSARPRFERLLRCDEAAGS